MGLDAGPVVTYMPGDASFSCDPADAFVVHRRLGKGSYGTVWLAAERQGGRVVAVKVLPLEASRLKQDKYLSDLRREIALRRQVGDPPAISRYHGSFVTPLLEAVWIVMEACEASATSATRAS